MLNKWIIDLDIQYLENNITQTRINLTLVLIYIHIDKEFYLLKMNAANGTQYKVERIIIR